MYRGKYVSYAPTDCGCVFLDMLTSEKQNTRYSVKVRTFFSDPHKSEGLFGGSGFR